NSREWCLDERLVKIIETEQSAPMILTSRSSKHHSRLLSSLIVAGNDVTGMEIQGKNHPAEMTIAANGVWMNDLLKSLEPTVLFQAQKGELLHLQSSLFSSGTSLPVIKPPNNQYILPLNNEEFIAGATHQTARHSLNPSLTAEG